MAARAVDDHAQAGDAAKSANPTWHDVERIRAGRDVFAQYAVDAGEEQDQSGDDQQDAQDFAVSEPC